MPTVRQRVPMSQSVVHPWVRRSREAGRPLVFAHRGGAALAPENTLDAFACAHALGVDGFELDVRLSRDGEVVVIHDADVDRTTDGTGRVETLTLADLQRLDAGARFVAPRDATLSQGVWRGRGARIPLLRHVLTQFPEELLIIELKGYDLPLVERTVDVVRAAGAIGRVCFGGFGWRTQRHLRRVGPDACSSASREETRWALYRSWVRWPPLRVDYQAFQVPETAGNTRVVSPAFLRAAHAGGQLVQVWTVNEPDDMRRLLGWGVDGLISDRPDVALQVRDAFVSAPAPAAAGSGRSGTAGS